MTPKELVQLAVEAMGRAYAPYSGFYVGAALLTEEGRVYTGCNIENAAFSPTIAQGERKFAAIAVVGGKGGRITEAAPPCGVCRQVMAEFCPPDFPIHMGGPDGRIETVRLGALLPYSFSPDHVK